MRGILGVREGAGTLAGYTVQVELVRTVNAPDGDLVVPAVVSARVDDDGGSRVEVGAPARPAGKSTDASPPRG